MLQLILTVYKCCIMIRSVKILKYLLFISSDEETLPLKKAPKIENVAGSVWLNLFMDSNDKCKLPSTSPTIGLSRIHHLHMNIVNFQYLNIRRYVQMAIDPTFFCWFAYYPN